MSFLKELRAVLTISNHYNINVRHKEGRDLVQAVFFYFGMMILYIIVLKYIDQWLGLPPHKAFDFLSKNSWQSILLLGIVIVPFVEELTFRLALKFTPLNLSIALGLLLYFIISILTNSSFYKLDNMFIIKLLVVNIFTIIMYVILRREDIDLTLQQVWKKHHTYVIFGFALIFTFMHIRNLGDFSIKNLLLMPLIVFPQLILAFLTSYFRLLYGLWYSIILHSIINAIPILFWLLMR